MKRFLILSTFLIICSITFAQVKDFRGIVVEHVNDFYKASCNKTTDNNGKCNEQWYGSLVNSKRDGKWIFKASYSKYIITNGRAITGNVTVIRNYKNGIPDGEYKAIYNISEQDISYNYLTDSWIYGALVNFNENVSGKFDNGIPINNWKITSNRNNEIINIPFDEFGKLNGVLKRIRNNKIDEVTYKNNYAIFRQDKISNDWGWELSYEDKDPQYITPQDTISLNDFVYFWDYYSSGMYLIEKYEKYYPENSSYENNNAYYILSNYDKYYHPYGNYPQSELKKYENNINKNLKYEVQNLINKIENHKESFLKNLNTYDNYKYKFYVRINEEEYIENQWLKDSIYPQYENKINELCNKLKERNITSIELENLISRINIEPFNEKYEKCMNKARNELQTLNVIPVDTIIWKNYNSVNWNPLIKKIKQHNDSINIANTFKLTEEDIAICTAIAYFKVELEWSTQQLKIKQIREDPEFLTYEMIKDFAYKRALPNNKRNYDIKGNKICTEKDVIYLINRYGYTKTYEKILKKINKRIVIN